MGTFTSSPRARLAARAAFVIALALLVVVCAGPLAIGKKKGKKKPFKLSFQENSQQLIYKQRTTNQVQCAGQRIASGGFELNTTPAASSPYSWTDGMGPPAGSTNAWTFSAHNRRAAYPDVMKTHAYCYKGGKKPVVVRRTAAVGSEAQETSATCPKGKVLIGAGWDTNAVPSAVDTSVPNHGEVTLVALERVVGTSNTLRVAIWNEKQVGVNLTAIAICGTGKAPVEVGNTIGVEESHTTGEGVTATCPGKKKVVWAGVRGDYHMPDSFVEPWATFITKLYRSSAKSAYAYGFNNPIGFDPTVSNLTVLAYCR